MWKWMGWKAAQNGGRQRSMENYEKQDKDRLWLILLLAMAALAALRYFWLLSGDYYTFLDEYPTFDVAAGFANTGKFYYWDFHKQTLTDIHYPRAWTHTLLLAGWFKLFGIHVVAGKMLSAVFGVLFIVSIYHIVWKLYRNYYIAVLTCLFLLGNPSVTTSFRQIRMYGLWLLVIWWFLYFVFQAFCGHNRFARSNQFTDFVKKHFDFPWKYVLLAMLFLVLGYVTHVNTLVSGIGILLFFLYLVLVKRERRYYTALAVIVGMSALFGLVLYLCHIGIIIPGVNNIYRTLVVAGHVGLQEEANIRYYYWFMDFAGHTAIMKVCIVCVLLAFLKGIRKRDAAYDFSVYSLLIVVSGLFSFLYLLNRYYQDRYMIYVAPFMALLMAWGVVETACVFKSRKAVAAAAGLCALLVAIHVNIEYINVYHNPDICYHRQVYEKIRDDAETEPIAIAGFSFRDYYGAQVLPEYETAPFDRAHDMEILYEFAKERPQGYVAVETAKIYGITESMRIFMQNHSERIAGEGIDRLNIDVCRYHFLYPSERKTPLPAGMYQENGMVRYAFAAEEGGAETELQITVDLEKMAPSAKILFLKFGIFTYDKETEDICYQLVLPEDKSEGICTYTVSMDRACQVVVLKDDCEIYFDDESYVEQKLFE